MTEQTLRRSNWPARDYAYQPPRAAHNSNPAPAEDPLVELERILNRGEARQRAYTAPEYHAPVEPEPAPALAEEARQAPEDSLFGVDEAEFEAALRELEAQAQSAPSYEFVPDPAPDEAVPASQAASAEFNWNASFAAPPREDDTTLQAYDPRFDAGPALSDTDPSNDLAEDEEPERKRGGLATVAVVAGLVVAGAGAALGYTLMTGGARQSSGEPVVVRADNRPMRVAAEPSAPAADQPGKVIFERLAGQQSNPAQERIVSREEQPIASMEQPRSDVRVILPGGPVTAVPEPRRVTTTTIRVRPDGTLESGPTRQAAAPPSAEPRPAPEAAPAAPSVAAAPAAPQAASGEAVPIPQPRPAPPIQVAAATPAPAQPQPGLARAPMVLQTASVPQTPAASTDTRRAEAGGSALVQIASLPSDEQARATFADLQRRYPQLLGGRAADIRAANLGDRGTFYRVRVGGFTSRDDAAQFCIRLRAAGGNCVIASN